MAQTGKTPKKKPSAAQEEFRRGYSAGRKSDLKFSVRGFNYPTFNRYLEEKRKTQRDRQTSGRMSFEKMNDYLRRGSGPSKFEYIMDKAAGMERYPGDFSDRQYSEPPDRYERFYPSHSSIQSLGELELDAKIRKRNASSGTPARKVPTILDFANGPYEKGQIMGGRRYPLTRNRPRGKTVVGMMTGPLLAGLGDYIGRNTSVGQQLRSQMMKQQPSKKR